MLINTKKNIHQNPSQIYQSTNKDSKEQSNTYINIKINNKKRNVDQIQVEIHVKERMSPIIITTQGLGVIGKNQPPSPLQGLNPKISKTGVEHSQGGSKEIKSRR